MRYTKLIQIVFTLIFFSASSAHAAPCCSANGAIPALIITGDQFQFALNSGYATIFARSLANQTQRKINPEILNSVSLDGSYLFSEDWQFGASLPVIMKRFENNVDKAIGIGDVRLNLAYEFLPMFTYSPIKPQGFLFLQFIFPTGISVFNATIPDFLDAVGEGRTTISFGPILIKRWYQFDTYLVTQGFYSFLRPGMSESETYRPVWKTATLWGLGWNLTNWRVGLQLNPVYQFRSSTEEYGESTYVIEPKLTFNCALETSYMFSKELSIRAVYTDQSLIRLSYNSMISRSFTVGVVMRSPN